MKKRKKEKKRKKDKGRVIYVTRPGRRSTDDGSSWEHGTTIDKAITMASPENPILIIGSGEVMKK